MTDPIPLNEPESTLEEAERIYDDLDQAHTLLVVARRLVWMSDGDGKEPTARMKPAVDALNLADDQLDALLAEFRDIIDAQETAAPQVRSHERLH